MQDLWNRPNCLAGLDKLASGHVSIGDADLGDLNDRQLTVLRRDRSWHW